MNIVGRVTAGKLQAARQANSVVRAEVDADEAEINRLADQMAAEKKLRCTDIR